MRLQAYPKLTNKFHLERGLSAIIFLMTGFYNDCTYSLLKLREQEYDAEDGAPADGDTPGVTISFISFNCEILTRCLSYPTDENRKKLNSEINRVVAYLLFLLLQCL